MLTHANLAGAAVLTLALRSVELLVFTESFKRIQLHA